jgi:hypothetical protein
MTFLWIVALIEFSIAVIFYVLLKAAYRDVAELVADNENLEALLTDSDESAAEHSRRYETMLSTILNNTEFLMADFNELKAAQDATDAKVAAVKTDVETLIAKLAAVPPAGLTAEQQAALDDAVTHANAINASLSAVDAEVNPAPAA